MTSTITETTASPPQISKRPRRTATGSSRGSAPCGKNKKNTKDTRQGRAIVSKKASPSKGTKAPVRPNVKAKEKEKLISRLVLAAKKHRMLPDEFLAVALGENEELDLHLEARRLASTIVRIRPDPDLFERIKVAAQGRQITDWISEVVTSVVRREGVDFKAVKQPRSKVSRSDKEDLAILIPNSIVEVMDRIKLGSIGTSRASIVIQIMRDDVRNAPSRDRQLVPTHGD
jgi:hypothetical protein